MPLGTPRHHFRSTDSTNLRLRELAQAGAPDGTLVSAGEQTAGRGRQGRVWTAPPGQALLVSVLIRDPARLLPLAAGVAVAETCEQLGRPARVKWPNDVLIEGGKVAGILVEGRPQERWAVLGIGVNVAIPPEAFPADLRDTAATLGLEASAIEPVLALLMQRLDVWLHAANPEILEAVRGLDALAGRRISWSGGSGIAAGIDGEGRLVVDRPEGRVALDSGEVHLSG